MSKNNKNNNSQNKKTSEKPAANANTNANTNAQKNEPQVKQGKKPAEKPAEKPKAAPTPPPADPVVEEKVAEEVAPKAPEKVDITKISLSDAHKFSNDSFVRMMDVAERHISRMKPGEIATVKMEQLFEYNLAWAMTKMAIQAREEKAQYKIALPNDDFLVQDAVDMLASLGVSTTTTPSADGKQMSLEFKEIDEDTAKAAKEEIKIEKATVIPEQDPEKWENEDQARKGLAYILSQSPISLQNKFSTALMKLRVFRKNQESDAKKKESWDSVKIGALFEDLVNMLGKKATMLTKGLCQGTVTAMSCDHNPIFAHATIKYNLPSLTEDEIADLMKTFIKVCNNNTAIEETTAFKNGILEPTRDLFLDIPRLVNEEVKGTPAEQEKIRSSKKIMHRFIEAYKNDGLPASVDPKHDLEITNRMITIRNLYVGKDQAFELFTESDYPKTAAVS